MGGEAAEDGGGHSRRRREPPNLSEGSILQHVIRLAIPGSLANLFNFSYNFINMLWLGRLGPSAIAVTSTYQYFFMVFVIFNQIVGIGSVSLIARTYGARQFGDCRRLIGQTFAFKLVIAIAVMVLGLVFQRSAWVAFGSAPEVVAQGVRYSTVMFSVIPIYFSTFTLNTALRGIGDMRRLMIISAMSTALNMALDPFFIFTQVHIGPLPRLGISHTIAVLPGLGMGVAGAAWASFASICVMFVMGLYLFTAGRTFIQVGWRHFFSWDWRTIWRILRIGTPPAIGENMTSVAQLIIGRVINLFGTAVFAANGINGTLSGMISVPLSGVSQAVTTMVGQNLGALKPRRAQRSVYLAVLTTAVVLIMGLMLFYQFAPTLIRFFVPGPSAAAAQTVAWGTRILRINVWMFLAAGLAAPFGGAFWGSGDTKPPMWVALGSAWLVQLPLILGGLYLATSTHPRALFWARTCLSPFIDLRDPRFIWWAGVAASWCGAVAIYLLFRRGRWMRIKI